MPRHEEWRPYALYILGPKSGDTYSRGKYLARLSTPSRCVYCGKGSACMRSSKYSGIFERKSWSGGLPSGGDKMPTCQSRQAARRAPLLRATVVRGERGGSRRRAALWRGVGVSR